MRISPLLMVLLVLTTSYSALRAQGDFKSIEEAKGLALGASIQNFIAYDQEGNAFDLFEALADGPVVLFFYRGNWCPFCNRHLSELEAGLELIYREGARVVAVSPEKPELMEKTIKKTGASFTLLYDEENRIAGRFDVAYLPEKPVKTKSGLFSGNKSIADETTQLPIPATYIIEAPGKITWRHLDPDYKNRASAEDIAQALQRR
ncbi:peroxiredoxin-like family protein [Cyclobacterium xiamenense]|uniref:peroxiredoxin-like family protein n=1 Tax=Cyclobacterium xiamenense TaxID=1297121 RepID=UPI0035CF97C5